MANLQRVTVQFYTNRQLTGPEIANFELKGNPYKARAGVREALIELGVFFYRDARHGSLGILLQDEGRTNFPGWKYTVIMETDNRTYCRPASWAEVGDPYLIRNFSTNSVLGIRISTNGETTETRKEISLSDASGFKGDLTSLLRHN